MPSIINLSFLPYQNYITATTTTCNNNTCYPFIRTNNTSYYNYNNYNNNSNNQYYYPCSTRNSPSPTIDSESYDEQEEEEEETKATCGECGKTLGPGWHCDTCRKSCPYCNRALGMDTHDYCERCFRCCDKHDIIYPIINSNTQEGPKCPQCQKEKD